MAFMFHDIVGLAAAVVVAVPLFLLPAYALTRAFDLFGVASRPGTERAAYGLLVAYATMPVLQSMGARFLGLKVILALTLLLAGLGVVQLRNSPLPALSRSAWMAIAVGFAGLCALWIDVSWNGRLYPTLLVIDLVKHAATVRSLVETGATPPIDPFFLRDQAASYYYFFYTPAALIEMLGSGFVDSRAAVGGMVFWTGIAVVTLARIVLDRAGLLRDATPAGLVIALMLAGGLQLLIVSPIVLSFGWPWPGQLGWIRDDLASWPVSMIWVPHHLSGMIASWIGFLALIEAQRVDAVASSRRKWTYVALAGIAFASACGLSTWLTIGAVMTLAIWSTIEVYHRRWNSLVLFAAAGVIALVVAAPHMLDLVRNRSLGVFPIAFEVRMFVVSELLIGSLGWLGQNLVRALFLPLHYVMAAGIFFAGAFAFWTSHRRRRGLASPEARLLAYSAAASLFVGSFFQSVVANNDLGWRVVLFGQLAALLWTAAYLEPLWRKAQKVSVTSALAKAPPALMLFLGLGYAGVAYDLIATRFFSTMGKGVVINPRNPAADFEARDVYGWINANLGPSAVVQHNPDTQRALGYGLYGRQRTALADRHNALLFGPSHHDVSKRMSVLKPVFTAPNSAADVAKSLVAQKVDTIIVSSDDPVWKDKVAWVFATPALYQTAHLRVLRVRDLKDQP